MRAILVILISLLVLATGLLVGDYFNVMLWPINILNRMYQLEILCRIDDLDSEIFSAIMLAERGINCDIRYRDQRKVRRGDNFESKTDAAGVYRMYLPEGHFLFRAEVLGYLDDRLYHYATGPADSFLTIEHNASGEPIEVLLTRLDVDDFDIMQVKLERLYKAGGIDAAKALLDERLSRRSDSMTAEQTRTLEVQAGQLVQLIDQCSQFLALEETQYVSKLQRLQTIRDLFVRLAPSLKASQYQCRIDDKMVNIAVSSQSIRESLATIISEYLVNMDSFMEIRRHDKVYEFWLRFTTNPELYHQSLVLDRPDLQAKLQYYTDTMPDVQQRIVERLEIMMQKGRDYYEAGQLDQAYNSFFRCQQTIDEFRQDLELSEDLVNLISSYLQDLQTIRIARSHEEMNDWQRARELYDQVVNDCQWLKVLKADLAQRR